MYSKIKTSVQLWVELKMRRKSQVLILQFGWKISWCGMCENPTKRLSSNPFFKVLKRLPVCLRVCECECVKKCVGWWMPSKKSVRVRSLVWMFMDASSVHINISWRCNSIRLEEAIHFLLVLNAILICHCFAQSIEKLSSFGAQF